jgi:hypothetical protein
MAGEIDDLISQLSAFYEAEALKSQSSGASRLTESARPGA